MTCASGFWQWRTVAQNSVRHWSPVPIGIKHWRNSAPLALAQWRSGQFVLDPDRDRFRAAILKSEKRT